MSQMTAQPLVFADSKTRWTWPILVLLILSGAVAAANFFKYDFVPKRFGVVDADSIYRSGQISPRLIKPTLEKYHIASVIDLQSEEQTPAQLAEQQAVHDLGIDYHRYPLSGDGTGKIANYAAALQMIVEGKNAGKTVLIHCSAGTQRTGVAVAYYRLLIENRPAGEVFAEMQAYGWSTRRDAAGLAYINAHMGEMAGMLVERGVLARVPSRLPMLP